MKRIVRVVNLLTIILLSSAAFAGDCESNYKGAGALLKGKTYSTFADFTALEPSAALRNLSEQLPAEGIVIQSVDAATGTLSALAVPAPGRSAPVVIRAEAIDGGTRVHFSVDLPTGAFGNAGTKAAVCRFIELARVDPATRYQHPLMTFIRTKSTDANSVAVVESNTKKRIGKMIAGAAGGALLGALHAKVTGGDVAKEAAIGALAGGALTFAISRIQDQRMASRDEVMLAESYDPSQGYRAGVRRISVEPASVKPGQKITIVTTYWALAPGAAETFGLRRYAGIALSGSFLRGFRFNPEPFRFADGGGEYQTTIELDVPAQTPPGSYTLHWVIDGQSTGGDNSTIFTVAG
ncbi:MAG TPA: hypothetical protein VHL59_14100 [Thermoanaerobaculia bacterium]|nr:hypothetical protein [Thermoanaerobaculia bacterium]